MDKRYQFFKRLTVYLTFFIVLLFSLIKAQEFIVPILLAILFAYLLYPVANFLERKGIPRIISNLISIFLAFFVLGGVIFFIYTQISQLTENLPEYMEQASTNISRVAGSIASLLGMSDESLRNRANEFLNESIQDYSQIAMDVFAVTSSTIVRIFLMPVYVFFILFYRNKVYDVILAMVSDRQKGKSKKILSEVNSVCINYMTGLLIVVAILSITHSVALSIIGIEFAILLGVIAAIFNFIPYFGTLIGAIFPLVVAFLTADSLSSVLWIVVYFIIIQFVENNILTPSITGGKVSLNPFVTILSLIFGSMIWGIAGMFIIVPYMAMVRIFLEHIDFLKPIGFLLSDKGTEKYALSGQKIKKFFTKG